MIGFGNRGQQNYNASVGNEKFTIGYNLEKFGKVTGISESDIDYNDFEGSTRTDADNVEKNNVSLGYNITDNLNFSYNYFETKVDYNRFVDSVKATSSGIVCWRSVQWKNLYFQTAYIAIKL